ncbi:MAG: RDD family protein [Candidatus Cloacimonetes bacterium]|nr:RDD family protein [Candidatus Cloacimonadota bacterium]
METEFNLSNELCEKILTIFLLELNQTSKVSPAEKYYFKNLNKLLQIDPANFQRLKKESIAFRPPLPQDRVIDLKQFFKESLTTLNQVHSKEESEDIVRYMMVSMDCSSHFTLEALDQLFDQSSTQQPAPIINDDEPDFFSSIEDNSDFHIIEDSDESFDFIEDQAQDEPILPPSVELSSPQNIALPKTNVASIEDFDDILEEDTDTNLESTQQVEPPLDQQEDDQSLASEPEDSTDQALEESASEDEKPVKKSKFKLPKISFDSVIPVASKHLQSHCDVILEKFKLNSEQDIALASYKLRVFAAIIDTCILMLFVCISIPITMILYSIGLGIVGALFQTLTTLVFFLYFFKTETSKYQGSIGKVLCKIKVVNEDNQVMTSKQAILRNLFKFCPLLISNIVSIIVLILPLSILGLVSGLASLGSTLGICYAFINKKRQGVHDILAKSYVIGVDHDLPSDLNSPKEVPKDDKEAIEKE